MMIKKSTLIVSLTLFIFLVACSHYDNLEKNGRESSANGKSHNAGQDCMSCHNNASNEASGNWWNIAGTVYNYGLISNNTTVELWSDTMGTGYKIAGLVSDKNGNFYSEKIFNFNGGCYPIVKNGTTTRKMISKYTGGGCNSCHGKSTEKIYINQ